MDKQEFDNEEDALRAVEKEINDQIKSAIEKFPKGNLALHDAWQEVKALTKAKSDSISWQRLYMDLTSDKEPEEENLKEAWRKYRMIERLVLGNNADSE